MSKLRVLSLFSGIGAFEKGLDNLGIDYELVNYSEIDERISKCYSIIHKESEEKNLGDIREVDERELPDFDLMTYGFPCQAFSVAGNREGFANKKSGNLFFQSMRVAAEKKPRVMVAENVEGLLRHDKGNTFEKIEETLKDLGYVSYVKVLNASHFGVPQYRKRVFIVSIREDIDEGYEFPEGELTEKTIRDIVEDIPEEERPKVKESLRVYMDKKHFTREYKVKNGLIKLFDGYAEGKFKSGFACNRIYSIDGISPTLMTTHPVVVYELQGVLTMRERYKLQGFDPDYVDKLEEAGIGKGVMMTTSGNTIAVPVAEAVLKQLEGKYI